MSECKERDLAWHMKEFFGEMYPSIRIDVSIIETSFQWAQAGQALGQTFGSIGGRIAAENGIALGAAMGALGGALGSKKGDK